MDRPELVDRSFEDVWKRQIAHGVQVRVIHPSELPGGPENAPADFILFDKQISYETIPEDDPLPSGHPVIKRTILASEPQHVVERSHYFERLWTAARAR